MCWKFIYTDRSQQNICFQYCLKLSKKFLFLTEPKNRVRLRSLCILMLLQLLREVSLKQLRCTEVVTVSVQRMCSRETFLPYLKIWKLQTENLNLRFQLTMMLHICRLLQAIILTRLRKELRHVSSGD